MLEKGHFQELHTLLELLNVDGNKRRWRQNFVFSATLTMVHELPGRLKRHSKKLRLTPGQKLQNIVTMLGITKPKVVDITKETGECAFMYKYLIMVCYIFINILNTCTEQGVTDFF
jgi:ATP-dependent RNA helicase DDX24/MAK5